MRCAVLFHTLVVLENKTDRQRFESETTKFKSNTSDRVITRRLRTI